MVCVSAKYLSHLQRHGVSCQQAGFQHCCSVPAVLDLYDTPIAQASVCLVHCCAARLTSPTRYYKPCLSVLHGMLPSSCSQGIHRAYFYSTKSSHVSTLTHLTLQATAY